MDRTGVTQTWEILANAIDEIYNRNASQLSFEVLHRSAYNLVLHKHGTLLYEGVSDKLSSHLLETVNHLAEVPVTSLLEEMATTWSEHQVRCVQIAISSTLVVARVVVRNHSLRLASLHRLP